MADPLSIAASIAGLISITVEVGKFLGPYVSAAKETPQVAHHVNSEVQSTRVILTGLQELTKNLASVQMRHAALISIEHVVTILTEGVLLFSELEGLVRSLPPREGADQRLPLRARVQWTRKEGAFNSLLARLQSFKASMSLILQILRSDSDRLAIQHQEQLSVNIKNSLDAQTIVSKRMSLMSVSRTESQSSNSINPQSTLASTTESSTETDCSAFVSKFEFEDDLETSGVYRRARRNRDTMDFSFRSSVAKSHVWSILSGLSMSDVSIMSMMALPVYQEDLTNAQHYDFGQGPQPAAVAPLRQQEQSLLIECQEIMMKMLQIPGFQEYFNQIPQRYPQRYHDPTQIDAFYNLRVVLRQGMPLVQLLQALDPQLEVFTETNLSHLGGEVVQKAAIYRFLEYCYKVLDLDSGSLFTIFDLLSYNAYGFSKVIPVVSLIMEKLTLSGVVKDKSLPEILLGCSNDSITIEEFISDQRLFVRELQELAEMQDDLKSYALFRNSDIEFISSITPVVSLHIEFLVLLELNLFRPSAEQNWTSAFNFYLEHISKEAKVESRGPQGIFDEMPKYPTSSGPTASKDLERQVDQFTSQSQDVIKATEALQEAMKQINNAIKHKETNDVLNDLKRRVQDWKNHKINDYGDLLLYDSIHVVSERAPKVSQAALTGV
ncbi:hypothetical protein FALBO_14849 [Fusarium albosuccineum]|uniref:Cdc24/Scd1 N-terminal domain-containing protein n=1 Tax=Fusarium albosuccineum TaxID=1237068 RepID=A0A8H4KZ04_9HYPO|nr:hypothetical protein FALBO_14849 [Fusarium albosuccineum]